MQGKIKNAIGKIDHMSRSVRLISERSVLYCAKNIVARKQRDLIRIRSPKLAALISVRKAEYKTLGVVSTYYIGYDTKAVKGNMESVIMEYGRPGHSRFAKKTFTRKSKNGKNTEVKTGKVRATPHIELGIVMAEREAHDYLKKQYVKVLDLW